MILYIVNEHIEEDDRDTCVYRAVVVLNWSAQSGTIWRQRTWS